MTTTGPAHHGERRCYLRGCRRDECVAANKRYCKTYRMRVVNNGDLLRVPVHRVEHRVRTWTRQGWSQRQIAAASRCSDRVIHNLLAGNIKSLNPQIARRILTAKLTDLISEGRGYTDATGTRRRIQALAAAGWPFKEIAARAGVGENTPGRVLNRSHVCVGTANAIADVYNQIATLDPEQHGISQFAATKTRNHAHAQRWADPLFWEDFGGIDDPDAPETEGPETYRYVAIAEDALWLERQGFTREQIAHRLGVTRDRVQQSLRRYAREQEAAATPDLTGEIGELEVAA